MLGYIAGACAHTKIPPPRAGGFLLFRCFYFQPSVVKSAERALDGELVGRLEERVLDGFDVVVPGFGEQGGGNV